MRGGIFRNAKCRKCLIWQAIPTFAKWCQDNQKIDKTLSTKNINLENIMISLKEMWTNTYYDKSINSLQSYEFCQIIKNEEIKEYNNLFITSPLTIAINCFPTNENLLIDMMSSISKNVFSIHASNYNISQNYPSLISYENFAEDHEIGKCF